MVLSWTLDKIGPLALSSNDIEIITQNIIGKDDKDPYSIENSFNLINKIPKDLKIGIPDGIADNIQNEVKDNFNTTLKILESRYTLIPIKLPDIPISAATRTILSAEVSSAFEEVFEKGLQTKLNAQETHYSSLATNAVLAKDYIKSLRIQNILHQQMNGIFNNVDIIISPVKPSTASKINENFRWATRKEFSEDHPITLIGAIGNLIGLPGISIPNGFDKNALPTSFQIMGNIQSDHLIIKCAQLIQNETDWHNKHPN